MTLKGKEGVTFDEDDAGNKRSRWERCSVIRDKNDISLTLNSNFQEVGYIGKWRYWPSSSTLRLAEIVMP